MIRESFLTCSSRRTQIFLCVLLSLALYLGLAPQFAQADVRSTDIICGQTVEQKSLPTSACPDVSADYAILLDGDGNVLFQRDSYNPVQIASITKVMTAIVAYEYNPDLDATIKVTKKAAEVGESSAGLKAGDTMNLQTALKALLISSGNDAAVSIAGSLGAKMLKDDGESSDDEDACIARFVQAMNDKASEMNLKDTVFTNPHGLDYDEFSGDLHSCASDVATEVAYAISIDPIVAITSTDATTITVSRDNKKVGIDLESTDQLLSTYKGAVGVKTGFTDLAGACFAGAYKGKDMTLISVVLHAPDESARFTDTQNLWDWAKEHTVDYQLINSDSTVNATINEVTADYPVVAKVSHKDWPDKRVKATVADYKQTVTLFDMEGNVSQSVEYRDLSGDIHVGDVVGTIVFKQRNEEIARVDMVAAEDVAAPGIVEGIGIWWSRLTSGCFGSDEARYADSVLVNETPLLLDKTAA
ncbi:MAG: D-alanyl-D-alanine carboxypeptidase [Eggerthellales bacterium]|nr:D-alanyl-D-alanine carboxypeptidase [Eggerthellales bacterium]